MKLARNRIAGGESLSLTMVDQHVHRYGIVGQSRAIAEVFRCIELVAASRSRSISSLMEESFSM